MAGAETGTGTAAATKYIGIVIHSNALLFSNGITQNAYFIYQCLTHIGYNCRFLCNESNPVPFSHDKIPLYSMYDPLFDPDMYLLIMTVTRPISRELYLRFHELKIRVVSVNCGNHFMQDQEDFVRGARGGSFNGKAETFDEIWTLPSYKQFSVYMETLTKVPVFSTPHLWHHCILEKRAEKLSKVTIKDLMYDITKHSSSPPKLDIIIMEPNLAFFKNAWLPIIASESLFMKHPEVVNNVFVFNFPERPDTYSMIKTLSLGNKLRPFQRLEMDEILVYFSKSGTIPIFLSHQTNNQLNYLYYELLYFGFPLVHNSEMLDGCGYYYADNNIEMCVESIMKAFKMHNKTHIKYMSDAQKYLERVNPLNTDVCRMWNEHVKSVLRR